MSKRIIKKEGIAASIAMDAKLSLNRKPPLYGVLILNNKQIDKDQFLYISKEYFNNTDNDDASYSDFQEANYMVYGSFTREVAETIAYKIQSTQKVKACCIKS